MIHVAHGHCIDELRKMPAASVHCCVTSPPYWGLRDYKTPPVSWEPVTYTPLPSEAEVTVPAWEGHLGLEPDPRMFVGHIIAVFREVYRVLRHDGTLWLNFGDSYASTGGHSDAACNERRAAGNIAPRPEHEYREFRVRGEGGIKPKDLIGMPWRVAFALQADGWWLRMDNVWHKPNPMPESVADRPTKAHEYLFLFAKAEQYFYDEEAIKEPVSGTAKMRGPNNGVGWGYAGGEDAKPRTAGVNPKAKPRKVSASSQLRVTHMPGARPPQNRQNDSYSAAVVGLVSSRNKRSVWTVPTAPYAEAHFATFPPALITPCILAGTSAKGCCPTCGSPWERIMEKVETGGTQVAAAGWATHEGGHGSFHKEGREKGATGVPIMTKVTTGWEPSCTCAPETPLPSIPCTVLDPFGGSGTTGEVALEHGRHAHLIELGEHHLPLIASRLATVTPGLPLA